MLLFKKPSLLLFVSAVTFTLWTHELQAMKGAGDSRSEKDNVGLFGKVTSTISSVLSLGKEDSPSDPKDDLLRKYPLNEEGYDLLTRDAYTNKDEVLLNEVVSRHEKKQGVLSTAGTTAFCKLFNELADRHTESWGADIDFGKAAECYHNAEKLGDPSARKNLQGLVDKLVFKFRLDDIKREAQLEKLTSVYLREARADNIEFLKWLAEKFKCDCTAHCGRAARCFLKMSVLGCEEGITQFHALLDRFKKTQSDESLALMAKRIFPICIQEIGGDTRVRTFLEKYYRNPNFLKGVFSFYMEKGDADSVNAAMALYEQHKRVSRVDSSHLQPLIEYWSKKADAGDLDACHKVIEMAKGFGLSIRYDLAVKYTIKARELGEATAREALHHLLEGIKASRSTVSPQEVMRFFPLCLEEVERGDVELGALLERKYSNGTFLRGVLSYYAKKGDEVSLKTALEIYDRHKVESRIDADGLGDLRDHFIPKADAGDLGACRRVIEMSKGFGRSVQYTTAIEYCIRAIELGDAGARDELNQVLENASEQLSEQGLSEFSTEWIERQNDARLFYRLGNVYSKQRFYKDLAIASVYYFKAIALGHNESKAALQVPLDKLKKIPSDSRKKYINEFIAQIFPLYLKEAERDAYFCRVLANEYVSGELFVRDISKAVAFCIKAGKLEKQSAKDIHSWVLNDIVKGSVVTFGEVKTVYETEEQNENSDSLGSVLLAELHMAGMGHEIGADFGKACEYFKKAGSRGNVGSHLALARMAVEGHTFFGGKVDLPQAALSYRSAREAGHGSVRTELCALFDRVMTVNSKERGDQFHRLVDIIYSEAEGTRDPQLMMNLGNIFTRHDLFMDFERAAHFFENAERLGGITALAAFEGLIDKLNTIPKDQRAVQASKLRLICESRVDIPHRLLARLSEHEGAFDEAIRYYLKMAWAGDSAAVGKTWDCFAKQNADVTQSDCLEAIEKEVALGNPHAAFFMGTFLVNNINIEKKVEHFVNAARWGHPDGLSAAEGCYETLKRMGDFPKQRLRTALKPLLAYYLDCAGNGNESLNLRIANMYENVFTHDQDDGKSVDWYEKELIRLAALAARGDQKAYDDVIELNNTLQDKGFSFDQSFRLATPRFELELKKAQEGNPKSKHYVGKAYEEGKGTLVDVEQAAIWYLSVSVEDGVDFDQRFNYLYAVANPIQLEKLFPLYLAEAEKGSPRTPYIVGKMYLKGRGVSNDDGKALHWFERALSNKDPRAAYRLGQLYQLGRGVAVDIERAFAYYKQGKSLKGVNLFIEKKIAEPEKNTIFTWENFKETLEEFQKSYSQPSIYNDPEQSSLVKQSPLGQQMALVEEGMSSLSQIHVEDLRVRQPGFLLTALKIKQKVPGFIETFEYDSTTYISVGRENCLQTDKMRDALDRFHLSGNAASKLAENYTESIRKNESKLTTLSALSIGDEKMAKKFGRLSTAQERLINEKKRLLTYRAAGIYLKEYMKLAPRRNEEFFSSDEFGFLR